MVILGMKTDLRDYSKSVTMATEEIVDPLSLLKLLSPMLNLKGGIAGTSEVTKIVGMMKVSQKLVGHCIYLNIMRVTTSSEVLDKFITDGGWRLMNKWLSEAKETDNNPIVMEILKLLQRLPLKIYHLRENNTPKIVKHFAKSSNSKIKSLASALMNCWLGIIRESSTPDVDEKKKNKDKKKNKGDKPLKPIPLKNVAAKASDNERKNVTPVMKAPSFAKIRKTGLETELPPPKKKMKANADKKTIIGKRNSIDNEKDCPVPEKKLKAIADNKPKKITISEGFMDALNSASNPVPLPVKKIKRKPLKGASSNNSGLGKTSPSLDVFAGDSTDFGAGELMNRLSPKGSESPVSTEAAKPKLNKYGKPKKNVRWVVEERLVAIKYFEIDENERVNVTKFPFYNDPAMSKVLNRIQVDGRRVNVSTQSFKDAQHRELLFDRQQLMKGKMHIGESNDNRGDDWRKPLPIEDLEDLVVPGCNSIEKDIQSEREKTVLTEIFLTKEMVPESPAEPDPEPYEILQPKVIPFDDENSVMETMEPEQEIGSTGDEIILKNMLTGIQSQNGDVDLTEKLKQILQTANAMTNVIPNQPSTEIQKDQPQQIQPQDSNTIWQNGAGIQQGGNPQIMQPNMNGQNMPMGQMGFYGGPMQMMMPMQDPNYYGQNWNAGHMQNPAMINGHQQYGNFNNPNWSGPRWRRGGPPQDRGNWRGRWNNNNSNRRR